MYTISSECILNAALIYAFLEFAQVQSLSSVEVFSRVGALYSYKYLFYKKNVYLFGVMDKIVL